MQLYGIGCRDAIVVSLDPVSVFTLPPASQTPRQPSGECQRVPPDQANRSLYPLLSLLQVSRAKKPLLIRLAPAHEGVEGSEVADEWAKAATEGVVDNVNALPLTKLVSPI